MWIGLLTSIAQAEEVAEGGGFTLTDMWGHAGWIARGVIITLVFMWLGAIWVGIERAIAFNRARTQSIVAAGQAAKLLQAGDVGGALKAASSEQFKASYLASILKAGLREVDTNRTAAGIHYAHRSIDKVTVEELAKLRRGMTILATTGSTAPFVGLFGTTVGVINAFQGMSSGGSGLASISAGISEALVTTAFGIFVAVFGVWLFNYFNHRIEKVTEELSSAQADFLDWAEKLVQSGGKAGSLE